MPPIFQHASVIPPAAVYRSCARIRGAAAGHFSLIPYLFQRAASDPSATWSSGARGLQGSFVSWGAGHEIQGGPVAAATYKSFAKKFTASCVRISSPPTLRNGGCFADASPVQTSKNRGFAGFGILVRGCSAVANGRTSRATPADIWGRSLFLSSPVASRISSNARKSAAQAVYAICIKASIGHGNFWVVSTSFASCLAKACIF